MTISPGSSPGSWSPSPWKTIFWPSFIPVAVKWSVIVVVWSQISHKHIKTNTITLLFAKLSPLSMWTSRIFFWRMIFRPAHVLQRSLWLILCPWPWQLWHTVDTCCTIPGISWCMRTCMPVPWQVMHICAAPFRLPRPDKKTKKKTSSISVLDFAYSKLETVLTWKERSGRLMCLVIGQRAF